MTQPAEAIKAMPADQPPPLRTSRVFQAPRQTVFRAWSTAEHVKNWFSPQTFSVAEAKVEMWVGGAFEVCMLSPTGEKHWVRGVFVEVAPYSRLVIDMHAAGLHDRRLFRAYTEVTFADAPGGGTRMDVVQTYTFLDASVAAPMIAGAAEGWRATLDKLEQEVARMSSTHQISGARQ